jgi:hypothetical protein
MYIESRKFTFTTEPTGDDVLTKVWENDMAAWRLESVTKRLVPNTMFSTGFNQYAWDVVFERTVNES